MILVGRRIPCDLILFGKNKTWSQRFWKKIPNKIKFMKLKIAFPAIVFYIFICFGLIYLAHNIVLQFRWNKTMGIVLELKSKADEKRQLYPVVAFTNHLGEPSTAAIRQSSNQPFYKKGDEIPIIYNPEDSTDARINTFGWNYGFPIFFALLGFVALLIPSHLWHIS